jgi:hypothetical protein
VTIDSSGGLPFGMGECSSSRVTSFSVEGPSRKLSWDHCQYRNSGSSVERGSRTLSDHEFQAVLNTLSRVAPSDNTRCGADKPTVTLTAEVDATNVVYKDDFYACSGGPGLPFVQGIDAVNDLLSSLARGESLPTEIESLYFGFANDGRKEPAVTPQCNWQVSRYELEIATRELSWELCDPRPGTNVYAASEGSRTLNDNEVSSILKALTKLELGASKPCSRQPQSRDYWSFVSVHAEDGATSLLYDEAASCPAESSYGRGAGFVIGLSDVERVVKTIAH